MTRRLSAAEQQVVVDNLPLVRYIALHVRVPMEQDEREAEGAIGLMTAARTWQPDGGSSWKTWASRKISGAIYDAARRRDGRFGEGRRRRPRSVSLDREIAVVERILDERDPVSDLDADLTTRAELRHAILKLPHSQRRVVIGRLRGMTLRQIGTASGYTESRACQVFAVARRMMRLSIAAERRSAA